MKKMNAKRLLALMLTLVMLASSIPLTLSVSAAEDPMGTSPLTALIVNPTSSGSMQYDGYTNTFVDDLWLNVTLTKQGVLNFNCNKIADASGQLDYIYFYIFKSEDVMEALYAGNQPNTSQAIWNASYYNYEALEGDYNFNIPLSKGDYFIYLDTPSFYNEYRTLNWALNFTATTDYETEPNNGIDMANKMTLGKIIRGYTDNKGDYYVLKLTKSTPVRLYIGAYAALSEKTSISIALPDGTTDYVSSSEVGKNSSGYYYDVLLGKGTNVIYVSGCSASIKYALNASTNISYAAPVITDIEKEIDGSYFDAKILWDHIAGVDGYQIYRKVGSGSWEKVYEFNEYYPGTTGVSLTNHKKNTAYQFRVRAFKKIGSTKHYGAWSKVIYVTPTPTNIKLSTTAYTYNGKVKTPSVTIKDQAGKTLKKGTDYTVSYASGRKNVGTYKVTITFKGKYSGKVTKTFKIKPQNVSKCKVSLSATSYTYNGAVKKPTVTVKNAAGTKLTLNGSYTVSYASGRKTPGTYKVTIKMKGNYTGTKTVTFKILPTKTSISKLTGASKSFKVTWSKKTTQITGYEIQYSTSKSFKSYKTKTVTSNKTTSATIKSLSAKKTYYVRVRTYKTVNGKKVYSLWSTVKTVKTK